MDVDLVLGEADCIGTAAHVSMLARIAIKPPVFTEPQARRVVKELVALIHVARKGALRISLSDQDIHMAVERQLTSRLGDLGRRVHTARSRNDQVATDLRLYAREELCALEETCLDLAAALLSLAGKHAGTPMVGRTHMQPAMPSSVGLWAAAHAESLLDDASQLEAVAELNDQCPLGAAAGYGVALPIDREYTARALGFSRVLTNALYATTARGKCEAAVLAAAAQVMLTLSRLSQDLILYGMPEFGYFSWPEEFGTGSSIMPQKNNPDVLELVRARAARVSAHAYATMEIMRGLPSGYNRDAQETKAPLIEGLGITRASLEIMLRLAKVLRVHKEALSAAFQPPVFATDRALELVAAGVSFRDAYRQVKSELGELTRRSPHESIASKTHTGAPGNLNLDRDKKLVTSYRARNRARRRRAHKAFSRLLGSDYPALEKPVSA